MRNGGGGIKHVFSKTLARAVFLSLPDSSLSFFSSADLGGFDL